jgi:hypothetical protein
VVSQGHDGRDSERIEGTGTSPYGQDDLAPADYIDPVVEAYKKDVDRTLLRENLKLSTDERSRTFERDMELVWELRRVAADGLLSGLLSKRRGTASVKPRLRKEPRWVEFERAPQHL